MKPEYSVTQSSTIAHQYKWAMNSLHVIWKKYI